MEDEFVVPSFSCDEIDSVKGNQNISQINPTQIRISAKSTPPKSEYQPNQPHPNQKGSRLLSDIF